jgi:multiple antibiotic resistance protein
MSPWNLKRIKQVGGYFAELALNRAGVERSTLAWGGKGSLIDMLVTIVAFAVLCVITYGFFISGERLMSVLGQNGLNVITRIMGLILAVIGVQMLITGVSGAIKMY